MDNTVFLAQLMGPVFVVMGVAAILNAKEMLKMLDEFVKSFVFRYILAAIEMTAGLAIVLSHAAWGNLAAFLITVMGWGMVIEGSLWMLFPKSLAKMVKQFRSVQVVVLSGIVGVVMGLYWIYFGYVLV